MILQIFFLVDVWRSSLTFFVLEGGPGGLVLPARRRVNVKILSNNERKMTSLIDSNLKAMVKIAFYFEMQNFTPIDTLHFVPLLC